VLVKLCSVVCKALRLGEGKAPFYIPQSCPYCGGSACAAGRNPKLPRVKTETSTRHSGLAGLLRGPLGVRRGGAGSRGPGWAEEPRRARRDRSRSAAMERRHRRTRRFAVPCGRRKRPFFVLGRGGS